MAIKKTGRGRLVAVADADKSKAAALAEAYGAEISANWRELVCRRDLDIVIIAVPNKFLKPIALAALREGKHILCEKPFGRNESEGKAILAAGRKYRRLIKVGFNNRFHPGIFRAKQLLEEGRIGRVLFMRSRHGHGARVGVEKEWRSNPDIAGGGELRDQGVHLIDMCRWFGGEFDYAYGAVDTKYWKIKVDDNAFAILRGKRVTASFHVSTTNWGNIFSLEIFGTKGVLNVEGLGRHYGTETLKIGLQYPPYGNLKEEVFSYPRDVDESWEKEWQNFTDALAGKGKMIGDAEDGVWANRIADAIYRSSRSGRQVKL